MWKLTIEDDEQKQTSLSLAHDEYGVGRDETNSIRLTDRNISRKHALLRRNGQGWAVRDLGSYNGTYVNGVRVQGESHVGHGDTIQLGDYRLEFHDEAQTQAASTMETPPVAPTHQRPDRLVVVVGPQPGQEFPLDREHFTIGRSEEAIISINHSSVSRLHAELFSIGGGRYEIIDKGSANGIRINGQDVRRGLLEAGDALELGDVRLRFVGAGKVFRSNLDRQVGLPAIVGYENALSPKAPVRLPPPPPSGIGKMIALGVVLGILGVGALAVYFRFFRPSHLVTAPTASAAVSDDKGKALLKMAKDLADQGDLELAHRKIQDIPSTSPSLDDPIVKEVEGKWADSLFDQFGKATDPDEKKALVYRIASTPTVDSDRRNKALKLLQEIDPNAEDPLLHPSANPPVMPHVPANGGGTGATPSAKPAPSSSAKKPTLAEQADTNPQAVIDALLPRLGSGNLSLAELNLLLGLCIQKSNPACRDRVVQEIAKLKDAPPKDAGTKK